MTHNRNQAEYAKNLFIKAATSLQAGDAAGARKGLLKVARIIPDSAAVWYNLGLCHQHLGMHPKAIEAYRKSLKISPDQVECWVNIGISHKELQQTTEAERAANKALEMDGSHSRAHNLLATMAAERNDQDSARRHLEISLEQDPHNWDANLNLANCELEQDQADRALEIIERLLAAQPQDKQARIIKARALIDLKEFNEASPILREIEEEFPDDPESMQLGLNFREVIRDHFGAIDIAKKILDRQPKDAHVWNSLGIAYFQLDSVEKALECYQKAIELDPDHPEYANNMGLTYSALGHKDDAERYFRRSLELNPDHAEAYRNIATMKRFESVDDPDAVKMREIWDEKDLDNLSAIKASFALGKVYDDCGMYDEAFKVYSRGNELKFKESRIDLESYFSHIDRIVQILDRPPIPVSETVVDPTPIFILGMPRSGTTLVEQIISRHTEVTGCGELPCIERAISRLEKKAEPMRVYPNDFWSLDQDELERETGEYIFWVKRLHDIATPFITDKMPFNFAHVWLIRALFPQSAIIHCERHPLDVIISNYFQLYGSDIGFVYNLDALANYYVRYFRLMRHWKRVFGQAIHNIQYEIMVGDPETETRRLIDAAGLEWEDNCLDQSSSSTAVRTASIWQVRQGIYTRSRERWRNYESHLGEVIDILAKENILDGDGNLVEQE